MADSPTVSEVFRRLALLIEADPLTWSDVGSTCLFEITDVGSWTVRCESSPSVTKGETSGADCVLRVSAENFLDIVSGKLSPQLAFFQGKVKVSGDLGAVLRLNILLENLREEAGRTGV